MVDFIDGDIDRPVVIGPDYQIGWLGKWDRITIPGAITPATLQPIYKDDLIGLLKVMKLNAEDVKTIIAAAQFSDADRREIKELLSAP